MDYEMKCNLTGCLFSTLISHYIQYIAEEIIKITNSLHRPVLHKEDIVSYSMKIVKPSGKKPGEF